MRSLFVCAAVAGLLALPACGGGGGGKPDAKIAKKDAKKDAKNDAKKDAKADAKKDAEPPPEPPKNGILARHKVKDFAAWKKVFDGDEARRKDWGVAVHVVMQEDGNENSVLVGVLADDTNKVKEAMGSDDMKAKFEEAGVEGAPEATFWTRADQSPPLPEGEDPKNGVLVVHKVKDFVAWKKVFDGAGDMMKDAGIVSWGVYQGQEDPNTVLVHAGHPDMAKLKEFMGSDDIKKKMEESGVEGEPQITFTVTVEQKAYNAPAMAAAGGADPGGKPAPGDDAKADAEGDDAKAGEADAK